MKFKSTILIDTKDILLLRHPSLTDVLYFINDPIHTFFKILMTGHNQSFLWTNDNKDLEQHLEEALYYFIDIYEKLNVVDDISFYGHNANYTKTYEFLEHFIKSIGSSLFHLLKPEDNKAIKIIDFKVDKIRVFITEYEVISKG